MTEPSIQEFRKRFGALQEPHDIGWAMRQLAAGKKVRCRGWMTKTLHLLADDFEHIVYDGATLGDCTQFTVTDFTRSDWELYEPEPEGHDFHWALEQIKAHKRVRRGAWRDRWLFSPGTSDTVYYDIHGCCTNHVWQASIYDMLATDWVLA